MSTDLALRDPVDVAERLYKSGLFKDTKDANQALAKIMAGDEYGLGPVAALNGLFVIDGKIVPGAHVLAGRVKRSGRYDFRVITHDNTKCILRFYDRDAKTLDLDPLLGESAFSFDDAKRAGLSGRTNWQKYPRNMLFARALSNGVRWYCPDVTQTGQVLTAEEAADMAGVEYTPPGAVAEPVSVVNEAEKSWQPSEADIADLRDWYGKSGWWEQGAEDEHARLRVQLVAVGADNGVRPDGTLSPIGPCLARLNERQFSQVKAALVEAAMAAGFDAKAEV